MRQRAAGPLVEALLHDLRNPLNALSINLEVLGEKLRAETGEIPATQGKNLKAMREQINRMDALLRRVAEFLIDRPRPPEPVAFSALVQTTLEVLASDLRRKRLKTQVALAAELQVTTETSALRFLCVQALLRAIETSSDQGELRVTLRSVADEAVLEIELSAAASASNDGAGPDAAAHEVDLALQLVARRLGGRIGFEGGRCTVALPLAAS